MEILILAIVAFALVAYAYRRVRAGGSDSDLDRSRKDLPHDLRNKNPAQAELPNRGRPWSRGN